MINDIDSISDADLSNALVFFGALDWCAPCKMIHPIVEELSTKYEGIDFYYIDADDNAFELRSQGVSSVPTLLFFVNGEEQERIIGARPKRDLENMILKYRVVN